MIAKECFKKFRIVDYLAILSMVVLFFFLNLIITLIRNSELGFAISFLLLITFITFIALLINKALAVTLFLILASISTFDLLNFEIFGWNKVILFISAGIIFELVFIILKLEIKNIPLDVIAGATISSLSIPLVTTFILSPNILTTRFLEVFNLMLLALFVGVIGSIIGFLIWWRLRLLKSIIKFEYMQ